MMTYKQKSPAGVFGSTKLDMTGRGKNARNVRMDKLRNYGRKIRNSVKPELHTSQLQRNKLERFHFILLPGVEEIDSFG